MFSLVRDILTYLHPKDRHSWWLLLVSSVLGGVSRSLFLALISAAVVAIGTNSFGALYIVGPLALLAMILGTDAFGAIRGRMASERLAIRMRADLARKIGGTNLRFVERETPERLFYHLVHTVNSVADTYFSLLGFAGAMVTLLFNAVYIAWLSTLGLVVAVVVAVTAIAADWYIEQKNIPFRQKLDSFRMRSHATHRGLLSGYKELRLSERKTADYRESIARLDGDMHHSSLQVTRISAAGTAFTEFFQYLAIAAFGIGLPLLTSVPPVKALQLIAAVLFTISPLNAVVSTFPSFGRARVSMDNLKRLYKAAEDSNEPAGKSAGLPQFESLALKDVTFRFEEEKKPRAGVEEFLLGPVDFALKRGEVACVVGGNGSGKTVLMRLLTGLYQPSSGELLYNGRPLAREDRQSYRELFTAIFGDFFLFENLLGRRDASQRTVERWLDYFGLSGKTVFAEGAFSTLKLSTGQRKRLALIVAILDERPIMVLDEFGAEQDPEHRDQFYRVWLPELRKMGMTVVIISHDDAYFELADVLVRMDFGKIVECRRVEHAGQT